MNTFNVWLGLAVLPAWHVRGFRGGVASTTPCYRSQRHRQLPVRYVESSFFSCHPSGTRLYAAEDPDTSKKTPEKERHDEEVWDPNILVCDLLSIALVCQLMGLLDVLSDPVFWKNGGWLQPYQPSEYSTLPVLVQRFSLNSVLHMFAAWTMKSFEPEAVSSLKAVQSTSIRTTALYSVGIVVVGAIGFTPFQLDSLDLLRQWYFITVGTAAGRYIFCVLVYK